jgi:cytochrome c1
VPPDLSLIAKARGKRLNGALYVYQLLTTYYTDADGKWKNRAFAKWTHSEGVTSMPPAIPLADPELHQKSKDVAAFLYDVAEPSAKEREGLGRYVLFYMVILTGFLYAYNKKVWKDVKK